MQYQANFELSQWEHIGGKLKWISSGKNLVIGVNSNDDIYFRHGISSSSPAGSGWTRIGGKLSQIDTYGVTIVGANSGLNAYHLTFKETASMSLQGFYSYLEPNSCRVLPYVQGYFSGFII